MSNRLNSISRSECDRFVENRRVNPMTGRRLNVASRVAYQICSECNRKFDKCNLKLSPSRRPTSSQCEKFRRDPNTNPLTGRKLSRGVGNYNKFDKYCNDDDDSVRYRINKRFNACAKFVKSPLTDPETNKDLVYNGKKYRSLLKRCRNSLSRSPRLPSIMCAQLQKDPPVNPLTNRKLRRDSYNHRRLLKKCDYLNDHEDEEDDELETEMSIDEELAYYRNPPYVFNTQSDIDKRRDPVAAFKSLRTTRDMFELFQAFVAYAPDGKNNSYRLIRPFVFLGDFTDDELRRFDLLAVSVQYEYEDKKNHPPIVEYIRRFFTVFTDGSFRFSMPRI